MKKTLLTIIPAAGLLLSTSLMAQSEQTDASGNYYAGVQYVLATYDEDGMEEFKPTALGIRLGMHLNDNFSIEGRLATGMEDDSINDTLPPPDDDINVTLTAELDILSGVYGIGHLNVTEALSVYGLIGYTYAEWTAKGKATVSGGSVSASSSNDDAGLSVGFGAEFDMTENLALNLEYTQYLDESDYDISAIGLGVVYGF